VDDIPARAFDTPEEKERVAMILEQYNNDLTLTPEEDAALLNWRANAPRAILCGRTSGCPLRAPSLFGSRRVLNCCGFRTRFSACPSCARMTPLIRKSPACFFLLNYFMWG